MKISKTTEERYEEMLEILPPQATNFTEKGSLTAFLVGEPTTANKYASFFQIGYNYYEGEILTTEEFKAFCALEDDQKLAEEEDPEGEIAEELELIESLGEEVVKAGKYLGIELHNIEEAYAGGYDSDEEFAREQAEQTGFEQPDSWPYNCIDWEMASRDLMMDYSEHNGHYFRNF